MASRGRLDFADVVIAAKMIEEQADVAQLVEQLIRNQQVNGSSPFVGSIFAFPASLNLLWFEISTEILQIVALSP